MARFSVRPFLLTHFVVALKPGPLPDVADWRSRWLAGARARVDPRIVDGFDTLVFCAEPLLGLESLGLVQVELIGRVDFGTTQPQMMSWLGGGEREIERVEEANDGILVAAYALRAVVGFWVAGCRAVARAIAADLDGVVIDPGLHRPESLASRFEQVPVVFRAHRVLQLMLTREASGRFGILSYGMATWGAPDLVLTEITPGTEYMASAVLRTFAQAMMTFLGEETGEDLALDSIALPETFVLRRSLYEASAKQEATVSIGDEGDREQDDEDEREDEPEASDEDEAGDEEEDGDDDGIEVAWILDHEDGRRARLRVLPAPTSDPATWIFDVYRVLRPPEPVPYVPPMPIDRDAFVAARRQSIAELPVVRRRFVSRSLGDSPLFLKVAIQTTVGPQELWIAVLRWDDEILGDLVTDAARDTAVRAGMSVIVREKDVLDWAIRHSDESWEGATTDAVLRSGLAH